MWDLSSGQIRFKKSCSSIEKSFLYHRSFFLLSIYLGPITNLLVAKIDTDDVNEGSSISIPYSVSSGNIFSYEEYLFQ